MCRGLRRDLDALVQFVGCHDKSYEQSITGLLSRLVILTFLISLLCRMYNTLQALRLKRNFVAQDTAVSK